MFAAPLIHTPQQPSFTLAHVYSYIHTARARAAPATSACYSQVQYRGMYIQAAIPKLLLLLPGRQLSSLSTPRLLHLGNVERERERVRAECRETMTLLLLLMMMTRTDRSTHSRARSAIIRLFAPSQFVPCFDPLCHLYSLYSARDEHFDFSFAEYGINLRPLLSPRSMGSIMFRDYVF